jgi:8-oxo-dGTP pyrophosphatase MutT (NUDIX family)
VTPDPDALLRARLGPPPRDWRSRAGLRDAAVLAPIFRRGGADWLLLTERRDDLPDHPGQVAFPGGAREGDEDPIACALRESEEEIGLRAAEVEVLGRLPDRVSIAGFLVAAFVGRVPEPRDLRPDPREVARVLEVRLDHLRDESRWRYEDRTTPRGTFLRVPRFTWEGPDVWGLTGIFVRDLLEALGQRPPAL